MVECKNSSFNRQHFVANQMFCTGELSLLAQLSRGRKSHENSFKLKSFFFTFSKHSKTSKHRGIMKCLSFKYLRRIHHCCTKTSSDRCASQYLGPLKEYTRCKALCPHFAIVTIYLVCVCMYAVNQNTQKIDCTVCVRWNQSFIVWRVMCTAQPPLLYAAGDTNDKYI